MLGGCSETFSFLYADDSIQVNSETGKLISILIIYEVNNSYATRYRKLTADIASDITTEIFSKELFSDLTEKEKKIVSDYFIMGKQVKETAEELGISTRQVSRDKNSALEKMLKRMKAAGYESYAEAAGAFLQESDYIPTQMETQNSIMKKRTGEVRLPSDNKAKN